MNEKPLPAAHVDRILGLLERLDDLGGRSDLFRLAEQLGMELDDLMPCVEAAQILDFAKVEEGDIVLTEYGRLAARSDIDGRKSIFRRQVLKVPLFRELIAMLEHQPAKKARRDRVQKSLEKSMSSLWAERTVDTLINWGRYAEIIGYTARTREIYLAEPGLAS